jgi:hypothetical protein
MFETVNKLGRAVAKAARTCNRPWLAVELYQSLPVEDDSGLQELQQRVFVVTTLLSLQPTYDKALKISLEALRREISVVAQSPRQP